MPIISIEEQPIVNSLQAAYRPIVFKVNALKTDGTSKPPVVYCDVYFDGIYYKTIAKTQYAKLLPNYNVNQYYPTITIVDNGNGTQDVTFSFTTIPGNPGTLVIYPISTTGINLGAYAGSPTSPRVITIPTGNYNFIFEYYFGVGDPIYTITNLSCSQWEFDIQDICQEVLEKQIALNGSNNIETSRKMWQRVMCKFRSSGINNSGFIVTEGISPIQGTGEIMPIQGSGTNSNTFIVVNTILQHLNNQNLETHLTFQKNGNWDSDCFPLSHRKNGYEVAIDSSDFFPFFSKMKTPSCLTLHYKNIGQNTFFKINKCGFVIPKKLIITNAGEVCSNTKIIHIYLNGILVNTNIFPIVKFTTVNQDVILTGSPIDIHVVIDDLERRGSTDVISNGITYTSGVGVGGVCSFTKIPTSDTIYIIYKRSC